MEKKKILIAEIHFKDLMNYKNYLEENGYEVVVTYHGSLVVDLFKQAKPDFVIISSCLSSENSLDLVREIRKINQEIKMIMTGHYGIKESDVIEAGANLFLRKPVDKEAILKILTQ